MITMLKANSLYERLQAMHTAVVLLLMIAGALLSGCATVVNGIKGDRQDVPVTSQPPGATVSVDGVVAGVTPTTITMERGREHALVFSKDGYRSYAMQTDHAISPWVWGNILFWPGLFVDLFNSNAQDITPDGILMVLAEGRTDDTVVVSPGLPSLIAIPRDTANNAIYLHALFGYPIGLQLNYERSFGDISGWLGGGIGGYAVSEHTGGGMHFIQGGGMYGLKLNSSGSSRLDIGAGVTAWSTSEGDKKYSPFTISPTGLVGYRYQPVAGGFSFRTAFVMYGKDVYYLSTGIGIAF